MSWTDASSPDCKDPTAPAPVALRIDARPRELGGLTVRRILPTARRRMVGPFIFFDHMGPASLPAGRGVDVPPHPHIALATVTYLFEGALEHRDGLGSVQRIEPGAVNWMRAGAGIAHSERTPADHRAQDTALHGLQLWVALPLALEEAPPSFHHYPAADLPVVALDRAEARVLAGSAFGVKAPVEVSSPLFYVEARLEAGASLAVPSEYVDRAAYIVEGDVRCAKETASGGCMWVFEPEADVVLHADTDAHVMLLGGEPLEGPRHIWWNFVSSSRERIERAKQDWKDERFAPVPGETTRIPLPE